MTLLGQRLTAVRYRPRTDTGSMPHLRPPDRRTPNPHPLTDRFINGMIPNGAILDRFTHLGIPVTQPVGRYQIAGRTRPAFSCFVQQRPGRAKVRFPSLPRTAETAPLAHAGHVFTGKPTDVAPRARREGDPGAACSATASTVRQTGDLSTGRITDGLAPSRMRVAPQAGQARTSVPGPITPPPPGGSSAPAPRPRCQEGRMDADRSTTRSRRSWRSSSRSNSHHRSCRTPPPHRPATRPSTQAMAASRRARKPVASPLPRAAAAPHAPSIPAATRRATNAPSIFPAPHSSAPHPDARPPSGPTAPLARPTPPTLDPAQDPALRARDVHGDVPAHAPTRPARS